MRLLLPTARSRAPWPHFCCLLPGAEHLGHACVPMATHERQLRTELEAGAATLTALGVAANGEAAAARAAATALQEQAAAAHSAVEGLRSRLLAAVNARCAELDAEVSRRAQAHVAELDGHAARLSARAAAFDSFSANASAAAGSASHRRVQAAREVLSKQVAEAQAGSGVEGAAAGAGVGFAAAAEVSSSPLPLHFVPSGENEAATALSHAGSVQGAETRVVHQASPPSTGETRWCASCALWHAPLCSACSPMRA